MKQAQVAADRAAKLALDAVTNEADAQEEAGEQGQQDEEPRQHTLPRAIRFAVGVAATGNPADIGCLVFQDAFATKY